MSLGARSETEAGVRLSETKTRMVQTANEACLFFERVCGQTAQMKEVGSQREGTVGSVPKSKISH